MISRTAPQCSSLQRRLSARFERQQQRDEACDDKQGARDLYRHGRLKVGIKCDDRGHDPKNTIGCSD